MLGKLFRPRWQHKDPSVRVQAVTQLDMANPESASILETLARGDSNEAVRVTTAHKLLDMQQLDHLIQQDPSPDVRQAATEQFCSLLAGTAEGAPVEENLLRLIRLTDNQQALLHVAEHSPHDQCREAATERLADPDLLLRLAIQGKNERQRLAAAECIEDESLLRQLTREGRDKRVLRLARDRLKAQQHQRQALEDDKQIRQQLLEQLAAHSKRSIDPLYAPRLEQLEKHWQSLADRADDDENTRAETLLQSCHQRLQQQQHNQQQAEDKENAAEELQQACDSLESLLREITTESWESDTGYLRAAFNSQQLRWQTAAELKTPDIALQARFDTAKKTWQSLFDVLTQLTELEPEDHEQRERLMQQWPANTPAPASLGQQTQTTENTSNTPDNDYRGKTSKNEQALDSVLSAIGRELNRRNLRHANRLWHKAESMLDKQPSDKHKSWMRRLLPRLEELRDWHSFAAEPKKTELCERMETLINTSMDPGEKANAIQALHDEWRSLMSSDQEADQALWDRFKTASDQAYEPCREHFRELDTERASNLQRRKQLCEQLSHFLQNLDPDQADWPAVWEIRRTAPQEWKSYQPIRFTDAREVSQQFNHLLEQLDEKLNAASEAHLPQLKQIITALEKLANDNSPVDERIEQTKQLQQRWKTAGWVQPRDYRPLHKQYRQLCDRIFADRDEQRKAEKQTQEEQRQTLRDVINQLQQSVDTPPDNLNMAIIGPLAEQLTNLPCPGGDKRLANERNTLLDRVRQLRNKLPRYRQWCELINSITQAPQAPENENQQRLALLIELETDSESPEHAREARMALQLERLQQAMKGNQNDPLERSEQLLEEYQQLLEQGLDENIRQRLLNALGNHKPVL